MAIETLICPKVNGGCYSCAGCDYAETTHKTFWDRIKEKGGKMVSVSRGVNDGRFNSTASVRLRGGRQVSASVTSEPGGLVVFEIIPEV